MLVGLKWFSVVAALAMLPVTPAAQADDGPVHLRICAMDVDYPPFGKVDGTGHLQYLVYQTAKNLHLEIERRIAPRRRCLEEIKSGAAQLPQHGRLSRLSAEPPLNLPPAARKGGVDRLFGQLQLVRVVQQQA